MTLRITHTVFGGADLEYDIGATLQMIWRQPTFARIHPRPRLTRATAQRNHGRLGDGAIAHARDVEE